MSTITQSMSKAATITDNKPTSFTNRTLKHKVTNYINDAYERWHDYAVYHNQDNKEKGTKVLNEVILDVLQSPVSSTAELINAVTGQYTQLDYMILKSIKKASTNNLELNNMNTEKTTREQMENVKLSDGTKEYLIAYKTAEQAANIAYNHIEDNCNDDADAIMQPTHDALEKFQDEILKLMMKDISKNLRETNGREI